MRSLWFSNGKDRSLVPRSSYLDSGLQNVFEDFLKDTSLDTWGGFKGTQFLPKINVAETETEYKLTAELPGLEEKDFEVILEEDVVKIRGEKKSYFEDKKDNLHRVESSYGSFERALRLPEVVSPEKTKANFKNGLLTLTIEKNKEATRVHKVKIES